MRPVAIELIITSMSSGENAETWLERGAEAFAYQRIAEAGQDFEKAVAADPRSSRAQLSLGVIRLFQYQNGVGEARHDTDLADDAGRSWTAEQWQARAEKRRGQIAEQNTTNAASAEEHLRRALELEPRNQTGIEYLASLYYWWLDPRTEAYARRDDAKHWYERLLEINPAASVCPLHVRSHRLRDSHEDDSFEYRLSAPAHG
jgi:tetratricopeptide (TPR) repeat protein